MADKTLEIKITADDKELEKSLKDEDFRRFWSLKNITPKWLKDAQHQKKEIKKSELDKYGLWDILPIGNFSKYLK